MLSATEIADIREAIEASLPETVEVQRATRAPDGAGGSTESWQAAGSYPARLAPAGGEAEREMAGRLAGRSLWRVTLPAEADVRLADRVAVAGRTFEVVGVRARSIEVCRVVLGVEEIQ